MHGHDRLANCSSIYSIKENYLEPIIKDEPSKNNTIARKIERLSDEVGWYCLYTACDINWKRYKVLFSKELDKCTFLEHGCLMAKLGRKYSSFTKRWYRNTKLIYKGLVYTTMDELIRLGSIKLLMN